MAVNEGVNFAFCVVARETVAFLDPADELFSVALNSFDIIIGQFTPARFRFAFDLMPLALQNVFVHVCHSFFATLMPATSVPLPMRKWLRREVLPRAADASDSISRQMPVAATPRPMTGVDEAVGRIEGTWEEAAPGLVTALQVSKNPRRNGFTQAWRACPS
jgi:hypothetical protein